MQGTSNWPDDGSTGKSLYGFNSYGANTVTGTAQAAQVSFDRPYANNGAGQFFTWDQYFVRWIEREGYDISYSSNIDTHRSPARLLDHTAFISIGHDEYWTSEMFDAAEAARNAGVHLAFLGANNVYWQVRLEAEGSTANRKMTCYKSSALDPETDPSAKTDRFRIIGRPEQDLIGIMFDGIGPNNLAAHAPFVFQHASYWPYAGTGAIEGASGPAIVGFEIDRYQPLAGPPKLNQTFLGNSPFTTTSSNIVNSRASIYQSGASSWVFAAGTMAWSWGLDRPGLVDGRIQGLTKNVFDEFLNPQNLGTSGGSIDTIDPTLVVDLPVGGSSVSGVVGFSGSATDDTSGVSRVELIVRNLSSGEHLGPDGSMGVWSILTSVLDTPGGLSSGWSYSVASLPPGPYYVLARAVDGESNASAWLRTDFSVA